MKIPVDKIKSISETSWKIESSQNIDCFYEVSRVKDICDCQTKCRTCPGNICVHTFSCDCPDYNVRFNICKHIHVCSRQNVSKENDITVCETNTNMEDLGTLEETILCKPRCEVTQAVVVREKLEILVGFYITNKNAFSEEELVTIDKKVCDLLTYVNKKRKICDVTNEEPSNKLVEKQNRFTSKQRSQKMKENYDSTSSILERKFIKEGLLSKNSNELHF